MLRRTSAWDATTDGTALFHPDVEAADTTGEQKLTRRDDLALRLPGEADR